MKKYNSFEEAVAEWEANKKEIADYYFALRKVAEEARKELEKNDPVYTREKTFFSVSTATFNHYFSPFDIVAIKQIMKNAAYNDYAETLNAYQQWISGALGAISAKEPKKEDFFSSSNFSNAHLLWELEKGYIEDYQKNFESKLEQSKKEREAADPVYTKQDFFFSVTTPTFHHDFKPLEIYSTKSVMSSATYDDYNKTLEAFWKWETTAVQEHSAKEPKKEDFFSETNYLNSYKLWDSDRVFIEEYKQYFEANVDNSRKQRAAADPVYVPVDYSFQSSILGITLDKNATISESLFSQYDKKDLENVLLNELQQISDIQKIENNEPKKTDFFSPYKLIAAQLEWKENLDNARAFFDEIKNAITQAIPNAQATKAKKQRKPRKTRAKAEDNKQDQEDYLKNFPQSLDELKVISRLGGSTGAELVEAADGTRYVRKSGNNEGHIRSECYADAFYRAAGADVPEFKLYETKDGPVKLSRYFEGTKSLSEWWSSASSQEREDMKVKLREQYATDVLLGNWDVVGAGADNILIDKDGKPWRIDNGGALAYRAQGAKKKHEEWENGFVDDLWTMTGNGQRIGNSSSGNLPKYFGDMDVAEIAKAINNRDWTNALERLPDDQKEIVKKRLEEVRQLAERAEGFIKFGYTRESTLEVLDYSYLYCKEGLREALSFTVDFENKNYGWFRLSSSQNPVSNKDKDSALQDKLKDALISINHHAKDGTAPNKTKVDAALALKPELEKAVANNIQNAQHYLDIVNAIEQAAANNTGTQFYDTTLPMYATQKQPQNTAAQALDKRFSCFSAYLRDKLGDEAVDEIEYRCSKQGSNSYLNVPTCVTKILRLRMQGFDIRNYNDCAEFYNDIVTNKKTGYYLGDPNGYGTPADQYSYIESAFDKLKKDIALYNKRYDEMVRYNAALQIGLENCDFPGNDKKNRTVLLGRTEEDKVVFSNGRISPGDKCKHSTGVNESHFVYKTVTVGNYELTMVEVPWSRINGYFMMRAGRNYDETMYLTDTENEVSADTHGLPIYYIQGNVSAGTPIKSFIPEFNKARKANP